MLRNGAGVVGSLGVCVVLSGSAAAQQALDLAVIPGVPGEVDSEFSQLLCYDWVLGVPVTFSCPPTAGPQAQALDGCVRVTVDGLPAGALTLRGFEARFEAAPTQTASYFGLGTLSHTVGETVVRMTPGAGPFVGVFDPDAGAFRIDGVPIEVEGTVVVTGTGDAGAAFPLGVLELSDFAFPPATIFVATLEAPTGEDAVVLSGILGSPLFEPGGRLDVGSGFVVGLGGGVLLNTVVGGGVCGGVDLCPADTNGDGELDSSDFFAWVTAFTADPRTPAQEAACDVNRDGSCTNSDFFAWVTAFTGAGCP